MNFINNISAAVTNSHIVAGKTLNECEEIISRENRRAR